MKFFVETFGCQMNVADSQEMGRHLVARGFSPTPTAGDADCILVNTCTVRQHAEDKAVSYLGRLADWKAADKRRVLVVAGCAAERLGEKLKKRFPQVSLVVGAKSIGEFDSLFEEAYGKDIPSPQPSPTRGEEDMQEPSDFDGLKENRDTWAGDVRIDSLLPGETVSSFVTIMRGCNYNCSYCIVPSVRGREIYRPAKSILSEVRQKAALGLKEVMLLGQTVNSYRPGLPNPGADGKDVADFADLLRAVNAVPGVRRIRFMSPHPFYLNEKTARAMAESPNVCRHMHLPAQSGSDGVLKRMRRNYTRGEFLRRLETLRGAMPDIPVTTDLIAGFPGETEEDFKQTLSLVAEADFDGAYVFKYSPRPGTESAGWPDDVPEAVKEERHGRLLEAADALSTRKVAALVRDRQEVLVEEVDGVRAGGRLASGRKVWFPVSSPVRAGDLVMVEIMSASGRSLEGRPL